VAIWAVPGPPPSQKEHACAHKEDKDEDLGPMERAKVVSAGCEDRRHLRSAAGRPVAARPKENGQAWISSCAIEDHLSSGARMNAPQRNHALE
jgi:hypothetical protein